MPRLEYVIKQEKINATDDGKEALYNLSGGDMRRVLNILQVLFDLFACLIGFFRVHLWLLTQLMKRMFTCVLDNQNQRL